MTRNKRTKEDRKAQAPKTNIVKLPERHNYNTDTLTNFLELVFHSELTDDEEILCWITKGIPAYPISEDTFFDTIPRTPLPKALYYSTSTATPDPADGKIYNRKTLFRRFHVLVLDDIGTKISLDSLPDDFAPTYIIETSAGNFQYGYVLREPITKLEQAEALIQIVYEAGVTDKGGRMANKLVRLPDGVNGKKGEKELFPVKLILSNGPTWSPTEILDVLDQGVTWAEVEEDADRVRKTRAHKGAGLSPWSPITAYMPTTNGIIDPALEWMYTEKMVKQETNEWVTIKCPWADQHTSGGDWASYSPLGWGGPAYQNGRGFKCFHEHCASKHGNDLVEFIENAGGPNVPVHEYAAGLISTYAFDDSLNGVWKMRYQLPPRFIPMESFKNKHPEKTKILNYQGKLIDVAETTLFIQSKARVDVCGMNYDPSTPAKLVENAEGENIINLYTQPTWGDGVYDPEPVQVFAEFIEYLIPDKTSREFYLDWLAAKVQDMAFRGPAILMIAPKQGTGRTTLGNMVKALLGAENVEKVPFERLTKGSEGYNDWIVKPMIITDETLALGHGDNYFKIYEKLKELIDTTPSEVRINPKYGRQRFQMTYSSFMLFSNHEAAMSIAADDRRIYVIDNVDAPKPPAYFDQLNDWLQTDWQRHVWRWLRQRDVNVPALLAPPIMNEAKEKMLEANKQAIDVAIDAIFKHWPSSIISFNHILPLLQNSVHRLNLPDPTKLAMRIRQVLPHKSPVVGGADKKFKVDGKVMRMRLVPNNPMPKTKTEMFEAKDLLPDEKQMAEIRQAVSDALDEADF